MGGVSKLSVENFLSHNAEKFHTRTLYCFTVFGFRNLLCFRGLCHGFLSEIFRLRMPKNFVDEPFCAVFQKLSSGEKVFG